MHYKIVHIRSHVVWTIPISLTLSLASSFSSLWCTYKGLLSVIQTNEVCSGILFASFFMLTWLTLTTQDSAQTASLQWCLSPASPVLTPLKDPSHFSPAVAIIRNHLLNSLFVSLVPVYKVWESRVLVSLFLPPAEVAGAYLANS